MKTFKNLSPVTLPLGHSAYWIAFVIWGLFLSMETTKKCIKCEQTLSVYEFYKDKKSKDGLNNWCRECFSSTYKPRKIYPTVISLPNEIWKDIPKYEGLYQVSNLSRVKSLDRYMNHYKTNQGMLISGILLKHSLNNGYDSVTLQKNGKRKTVLVHRLVAQAFIPNPENKPEVNHINGIKTDCRIENLVWATKLENMEHASATNLVQKGERCHKAKLKNADVFAIRDSKESGTFLAKKYGVGTSCIYAIRNGINWKHI